MTPRARRAALALLAPPTRPPRPPYLPSRRLPRRPGERREPLNLAALPAAFAASAGARRLELGCAVELALERALVVRDLDALGLASAYPRVLAAAKTTPIGHPLPPAKTRYLQMLLAARGTDHTPAETPAEIDTLFDVPLRLFPRVRAVLETADNVFGAGTLTEALQLEIAAVSDGRTMSEWAALAVLRLSL